MLNNNLLFHSYIQVESRSLQSDTPLPFDTSIKLFINLWKEINPKTISNALDRPEKLAEQKSKIKDIVTACNRKGLQGNIISIGRTKRATDPQLKSRERVWLKEIISEANKIVQPPDQISCLLNTFEDIEYAGRLPAMDILDVSPSLHGGRTPERIFRAVSANSHMEKPMLLKLKLPLNRENKIEWKHKIRKTVWTLAVSGASGALLENDKYFIKRVQKEKSKLEEFLELFNEPRLEDHFDFHKDFLRRGKYFCRRISPKEYFLYSPYGGRITINCAGLELPIMLRWYNPETGRIFKNDISLWERNLNLNAPFKGDAAIYMRIG